MTTRRELIEEMDYTNDAINWFKMYPSEDERYKEEYISKQKVRDIIEKLKQPKGRADGRYNLALHDVLKELGL